MGLEYEAEMINLADTDENEEPVDLLRQSLNAVQWNSAIMKSKSKKPKNLEKYEKDDFENLFSQFAQLKNQADNLPREERLVFAEKVVSDMWSSLGLDSDGE